MSTLASEVALPIVALAALALLGNGAHAMIPALTRAIVGLAARFDANHLEEVEAIREEHLAGIEHRTAQFGRAHHPALLLAIDLLVRVAIARRTREGVLVVYCSMRVRWPLFKASVISWWRSAIAYRRTILICRPGFWPGLILHLLARLYPKGHPRRMEIPAESCVVPLMERPIWLAEMLEFAVVDGLRARMRSK